MPIVTIKAHPNGNIDYKPGLLRTQRLRKVQWRCKEGPFLVSFLEATPFGDAGAEFEGNVVSGDFFETEEVQIDEEAEFRGYHYAVVIVMTLEGDEAKIVLNAGCPEVRVDP